MGLPFTAALGRGDQVRQIAGEEEGPGIARGCGGFWGFLGGGEGGLQILLGSERG